MAPFLLHVTRGCCPGLHHYHRRQVDSQCRNMLNIDRIVGYLDSTYDQNHRTNRRYDTPLHKTFYPLSFVFVLLTLDAISSSEKGKRGQAVPFVPVSYRMVGAPLRYPFPLLSVLISELVGYDGKEVCNRILGNIRQRVGKSFADR